MGRVIKIVILAIIKSIPLQVHLTPNGQTPPTSCPISSFTSSFAIIFAFVPKMALYLVLSILVSPAATIKIDSSLTKKR